MGFFVALQFLTRFPSPAKTPVALDKLGASIGWFPAVGALIGALVLAVDLLGRLFLDRAIVSAIDVFVLVAATGALHLDGVADTFDGFAAGPDRASRLAAMHQPQAGTRGAIAVCLVIFTSYAAIVSLTDLWRWTALLLAPVAGRTAIVLAYHLFDYARQDPGMSMALKHGATPFRSGLGVATAAGVATGVSNFAGVVILIAALAPILLVCRAVAARLGGLTGDVVGAACEGAQLCALLAAALLQSL